MMRIYALLCLLFAAQLTIAQEDCDGISGDISPSNATVCEGSSTTLTATGGTTYEWKLNDVIIDGETGSTINATQPGTYSVIIIEGECRVAASNTSEVTVTPTPTGTISPANGAVCPGGTITLTASGGDSYTWFRDGEEINGENNETLDATQTGTYTVLIHQDDCSAFASNSSTITASSSPTGTISPASSTICEGGSVMLTATGGESYTWFLNGNEINGEDEATLEADEPGTYSVTIHQGGCSGPASNTTTITQSSPPSGTISPANATFCQNGSVTLTASGGQTYTWFRNGNEIEDETSATLSARQAGTYTVIIHQGGCSAQASNSATVTQTPAPSGNITPANASICPGGSTTLTATGGTSYTWLRNGVVINGQTSSTLNVTQTGNYSVVIRQGTCTAPASNTATVTQAASPTGNITPASAAICEGGSVTLTASGGSSYTWFLDGNEIAGETAATLDATETGEYSVVINQNGCSGNATNTVVVSSATEPNGTISPATSEICEDGSVTLTATGGTSYQWFRNGVRINGQTDDTYNATQEGTYSVIVEQGGCSGEASNTAEVTIADAPAGSISPALASICPGGSVTLTATGGTSYTWFRNGNEIAGETGATLDASQPGTYSVTINNGACSGPASNSVVVTALPLPIGTISPATGSICEGGSLTLTATGGTTYTWFRDGVEIANETGATLTATQTGTYTAIVRQGTCSAPALNGAVVTQATAPTGSISPANGAICEGGSLELTATGGTSYSWYRNGNIINGVTGATLTVTGAGTYSAVINQGNCSAPASNEVVITQSAAPSGTISPATSAICPGGTVQLTVTGGISYIWYRDGNIIAGETGETLNVTEPGTYTATINQGECSGPASNSGVVTVSTNPTGTISPETAVICGTTPVVLTATGGTTYAWFLNGVEIAGQESGTLTITEPGTYSVIIENGSCTGPASNTVEVTAENVNSMRYPDVTARTGTPVKLEARDIGTAYEWIPADGLDNSTSRTPTIQSPVEREYIVRITTTGSCVISDTVKVVINASSSIFVPTGFSPNKDGNNDLLRPLGQFSSLQYFRVFNRWGQMVYQTNQLNAGWDGMYNGKPQPLDTYTWILSAVGIDGKPVKKTGKTLLIR